MDAADRAIACGRPFNRFLTLLWQRGGIDEREAVAATTAFLKLASDWMRTGGGRLCWAYTMESGARNGAHAHILLHVPPHLDRQFRVMPRRWATRLLGGFYVPKVVRTRRIRGADAEGIGRDLYQHALRARLRYLLKAAPPDLEEQVGLDGIPFPAWGRFCQVYGRRAGWWQERGI